LDGVPPATTVPRSESTPSFHVGLAFLTNKEWKRASACCSKLLFIFILGGWL